jgi:hypothetical protein
MKLIALIVLSIAAYAITLGVLDRVLRVDSESQFYWLCFFVSSIVLAIGLFVGLRRAKTKRTIAIATVLASVFLVFAGDIVLAVAYSCSKGVCL